MWQAQQTQKRNAAYEKTNGVATNNTVVPTSTDGNAVSGTDISNASNNYGTATTKTTTTTSSVTSNADKALQARDLGITAGMTDTDLEAAYVQTTKVGATSLIPLEIRIIFCLIVPILLAGSILIENEPGVKLGTEIVRVFRFTKSQHVYLYRTDEIQNAGKE